MRNMIRMMAIGILAIAFSGVANADVKTLSFAGVAQDNVKYFSYCDTPAVDDVGVVLPISGGSSLRSSPYTRPYIVAAWEDMITKSYSSNKAFRVYYDTGDRSILAIQMTPANCQR